MTGSRSARASRTIVGWMASSVGLAAPGSALSAAEVLAAFDPARLRREPTVWTDGALGQPPPAAGRP